MSDNEVPKTPSPSLEFSAGVVAGAAGLIVGQPFDVVKVRYQTPDFAGRYSSIFGALGGIVREEGARGLFKGVLSPMAGIAFVNGLVFASYSGLMRLQVSGSPTVEPSLGQICLAGAGSGAVAAFITCPTELIKIRQQTAHPRSNPTTINVIRELLRSSGIRGLYRGFSATVVRELGYGPYFGTYEAVCRFFRASDEVDARVDSPSVVQQGSGPKAALHWAHMMLAGGCAGVIAWTATFPFDVFKTRMQAVPWSTSCSAIGRPPSLLRVMSDSVRKEGWRVCFAGLGPTLIRAVPVNMVVFLTYEACLNVV